MIQTNPHGRQVDTRVHEAPRHVPIQLQGPDHDDFLKQDTVFNGLATVLFIAARAAVYVLALIGAGAVGRHFNLF